ncbi:MAG: hypothetical protein QW279_10630, partial [Candidatus Jordarchaeaceae archaeon]
QLKVSGAVYVLSIAAILTYLFEIMILKKRRLLIIEGLIVYIVFYSIIIVTQVSHAVVHEYLLIPLIVPQALLCTYLFNKMYNLSVKIRFKSFLLLSIVLSSSIFYGLFMYNDFYAKQLNQGFPDAYGNMGAVDTGRMISMLPIKSDSLVLVQSDAMGIYTLHPYLTWYDLWSLNLSRLHALSLVDLAMGKNIYDSANVFDSSFVSQVRTVNILSSLNLSCVVVSPEISDMLAKSPLLLDFINQNFIKIRSISCYTIMVSINELRKESSWDYNVTIDNWKIVNFGTNGAIFYTLSITDSVISVASKPGNSTHWFIENFVEKPLDLKGSYMSFYWFGHGTGKAFHAWVGNDIFNRNVYIIYDYTVGWIRYIISLEQPDFVIGNPNVSNVNYIGIGDFGQGESIFGKFLIKEIYFWEEFGAQ